jgi:hypothetical protein
VGHTKKLETWYNVGGTIFLPGANMKSVNMEEDLKREITQEEADARLAHFRLVCAELDKANAESPLPDDFIEYVKGRKTLLTEPA